MSFISSFLELSLGRDAKYLNTKLHTITCLPNDSFEAPPLCEYHYSMKLKTTSD